MKTVYLILENGAVFEGSATGAKGTAAGELAVDTLASCQEEISNPSNFGKLLCFTPPFAGTYGINADDMSGFSAAGAIFHEVCETPSNFRCEMTLPQYLEKRGVVGITGVDTRKISAIIREHGVMNAVITPDSKYDVSKLKNIKLQNPLKDVSVKTPVTFGADGKTIAVLDLGVNKALLSMLAQSNRVIVFPYLTTYEEISAAKPDGIVVAGGPGSPDDLKEIFLTLKKIYQSGLPVLATGLGHNALAAALGFANKKLTHTCHGNFSNRNLKKGSVLTVNCSYDYCVSEYDNTVAEVAFSDVHSGNITGLGYKGKKITSVQFNPELNEYDTHFIVKDFIKNM